MNSQHKFTATNRITIITRKTSLTCQQMTKVLASALKVIVADQTNRFDPHNNVKETKLKRLKLGQLEEEEDEGGETLDERLVKEAREAIGYLQLDLPTTQLSEDLESEMLSVEHGNIAEMA